MAKTPYEEYKAKHTVHSLRRWSIHANQESNDLFSLFFEAENNGFPFSRRLSFEKAASSRVENAEEGF